MYQAMNEDFDNWLEQRLASGFARMSSSTTARPLSASLTRSKRMRFVPILPVALSAKAAAGLTLAALATAGGAAAISDATGHSTFGQDVATKAQWCAQHLSKGQIGDCVSDFVLANNPGVSHRAPQAQPDATTHGQAGTNHPRGGASPAGAPPANPSSASTTHSAPVSHPTGKP